MSQIHLASYQSPSSENSHLTYSSNRQDTSRHTKTALPILLQLGRQHSSQNEERIPITAQSALPLPPICELDLPMPGLNLPLPSPLELARISHRLSDNSHTLSPHLVPRQGGPVLHEYYSHPAVRQSAATGERFVQRSGEKHGLDLPDPNHHSFQSEENQIFSLPSEARSISSLSDPEEETANYISGHKAKISFPHAGWKCTACRILGTIRLSRGPNSSYILCEPCNRAYLKRLDKNIAEYFGSKRPIQSGKSPSSSPPMKKKKPYHTETPNGWVSLEDASSKSFTEFKIESNAFEQQPQPPDNPNCALCKTGQLRFIQNPHFCEFHMKQAEQAKFFKTNLSPI